jgi:hypothetical protein
MLAGYIIDNGREDVIVPVNIPEPDTSALERYGVWNEEKLVHHPEHPSISLKITADGGIVTALILKDGKSASELFCHLGNRNTDRLLELMKERNYASRKGRDFITPDNPYWIYQVRINWDILTPMDQVFVIEIIYPVFGAAQQAWYTKMLQENLPVDIFEKMISTPEIYGERGMGRVQGQCFFSMSFFDVELVCEADDPMVTGWSDAPLSYGIFIRDSIPFLLITFPETGCSFDTPINGHNIESERRLHWLALKGRTVNLKICHEKTGKILAQRTIELDEQSALAIRQVVYLQWTTYKDDWDLDGYAIRIQTERTVNEMMKLVKMIPVA